MTNQPPIEFDWYEDALMLLLGDEVVPEMLKEVAFQIQGQVRVNITNNNQVDTGAMRNSVYVDAPGLEDYQSTKQAALSKNPNAPIAPVQARRNNNEAVVGVAVGYAVFQEKRKSFLFAALQQQQGQQTGSVIQKIAKNRHLTR